tara:strand:- start:256 stop:456 length:201 start_codon:yes stop_codon:yes gene_type:complete
VNREERLITLKKHLKMLVKEFVVWWGTSHLKLAEEIDMVITEIEEMEETIKLEKEILDKIAEEERK